MPLATLALVTLAALLHVFFWVLESLRWRRPDVWKRFGAKSQEEADVIAPMAYNQGFYNLFLAIGALVGVGFTYAARDGGDVVTEVDSTDPAAIQEAVLEAARESAHTLYTGETLIIFTMLCMLGAALVLVLSNRKMARGAAIQGGLPALALLIALVA